MSTATLNDINKRERNLTRCNMLINFTDEKEMTIPCMNNGTGMMTAKMFIDNGGKIITCSIHKGGSIGTHRHETSDEINYVLSGEGKAICDGMEETLSA